VFLPILILNIWRWDIDKGAQGRGKRSRSVREDNDTLDIQRQVPLRHTIHLWVIVVWCQGRWKPWVVNSGTSTEEVSASLWTCSISSDQFIYIGRCLLRFESLCMTIPSRLQDNPGNPDRSTYLLAIDWNIELICIDNIPWSRLNRWLPRDRGKHMLKLHWWGSPYHHGGPGRSTNA
jgi:hypothetical protein